MLRYNFQRVFKMKGISKPAPYLMSIGFTKDVAYRISGNKLKAYSCAQIGRLCYHLECTPDELMEWTDDEKNKTPDYHPLNKLKHAIVIDLRNISWDVPVNKINEFAKQVEELKKNLLK